MSKNKEIKDEQGIAVPTSTVDRLYRDLVQLQLIKKNRNTHCWDCKEKIQQMQMEVALNVRQEFPVQIVDLAFVKNLKKTKH